MSSASLKDTTGLKLEVCLVVDVNGCKMKVQNCLTHITRSRNLRSMN